MAFSHRLPIRDAVTVHIDLEQIRKSGLIPVKVSTAALEDAEYRRFVTESGFDWKTDLDELLASKLGGDWFIFARGRFDWAKLRSYVAAQNGGCHNGVCEAEGVTLGRWISLYPVSPRIVAFASSESRGAVYTLQRDSLAKLTEPLPEGPLWLTFPGRALAGDPQLPSGSRLIAKVLAETKRVTFSIHAPHGTMELFMSAECSSPEAAETMRKQLDIVTVEFRKYFDRMGQKPPASDLAGVLLAGRFDATGTRLMAHWPIDPQFIDSLLAGGE